MDTNYSSHFVGREQEMNTLSSVLEDVINNRRLKVILVGSDFGVGKSALITNFIQYVKRNHPKVAVGLGECWREGQGSGLAPVKTAFDNIGTTIFRKRWEAQKHELIDHLGKIALAWLNVGTGGLSGATLTTLTELHKFGQVGVISEGLFYKFCQSLESLCRRNPVVLILEDIHWADDSTLDLLLYVIANMKEQPLMVICSYRIFELNQRKLHGVSLQEHIVRMINLGAMDLTLRQELDIGQYLSLRYPKNTFPKSLIDKIQTKSGGLPLYIVNLFNEFEASGQVARKMLPNGECTWEILNKARLFLPDRLEGLVDLRLRSIGSRMTRVLRAGAVEGDEFTAVLIAGLVKISMSQLDDDISRLDKHFLLIKRIDSLKINEDSFSRCKFSHAFIRDFIYEQMLPEARRDFHAKIACELERLADQTVILLKPRAHHNFLAGRYMEAANLALLSAKEEQYHHRWNEAEYWCNFGLDAMRKLSTRQDATELEFCLIAQLIEIAYLSGDSRRAAELGSSVRQRLDDHSVDKIILADFLSRQADALEEIKEYEIGLEQVRKAEDLLMGKLNFKAIYVGYGIRKIKALLLARIGENEVARTIILKLIDELESGQKDEQIQNLLVEAYNIKAILSVTLEEEMSSYHRAIDLADKLNYGYFASLVRANLADTLLQVGGTQEALNLLEEALMIEKDYCGKDLGYIRGVRGRAHIKNGNPREGVEDIARAIESLEKFGGLSTLSDHVADLALGFTELGRNSEAVEYMTRAIALAGEDPYDLGYVMNIKGMVEAKMGDIDRARTSFETAIRLQTEAEADSLLAWTYIHYAQLLTTFHEYEAAQDNYSQASIIFDNVGNIYGANFVKDAIRGIELGS